MRRLLPAIAGTLALLALALPQAAPLAAQIATPAATTTPQPTPTATPALLVDVSAGGQILSYGNGTGPAPAATLYPLAPVTANAVATAFAASNGGVQLSNYAGPDGFGQYQATVTSLPTPTPMPSTGPLAAGAAAGGSPPAPTLVPGAGSNQQRGAIRWGTGTVPGAGAQVVATFPQAFANPPAVLLVPMTAATAACQPYVSAVSAAAVTIACALAPAASQSVGTYQVIYVVVP